MCQDSVLNDWFPAELPEPSAINEGPARSRSRAFELSVRL
jgi:hypothetical protein